jgi:hypothetical protein
MRNGDEMQVLAHDSASEGKRKRKRPQQPLQGSSSKSRNSVKMRIFTGASVIYFKAF